MGMTDNELLASPEVQTLIEAKTTSLMEEIDSLKAERDGLKDKTKELETQLADARGKVDTYEAEKAERELAEYRAEKIAALEVSQRAKELLEKRVGGETKEAVDTSIDTEVAFIKEVAPDVLTKEAPTNKGIPPAEKDKDVKPKDKPSDRDILMAGNPNFQIAEAIGSIREPSEDED